MSIIVITMKSMRYVLIITVLSIIFFFIGNTQSHLGSVFAPPPSHVTSIENAFPDWTSELGEHQPIVISSDADFSDQGWAGNGSESDPFIIENLRIRAMYTSIAIVNTTRHFEIRRCFFTRLQPTSGGPAVTFRNVTNGCVTGCIIIDTDYAAVIRDSRDCLITDNEIYNLRFDGIELYRVQETLIANNTIHQIIGSGAAVFEAANFTIGDNRFYDCHRGLYLTEVQSCVILRNTIWRNTVGAYLAMGDGIVTNNSVYGNTEIGIQVDTSSASNMIYSNHIGWNTIYNAEDNSNSTSWDDGLGSGNSWSDFNGTGQYPISGGSISFDRWPMVLFDNSAPVVDPPLDIDFEYGSTGLSLTWNAIDEFPLTYQIIADAVETEGGTWADQVIMIPVDSFQPGTHYMTLRLWDAKGNYATDSVSVLVAAAESPVINHPLDIEYVVGETGHNITWIPEDAYPKSYEIFINKTSYVSGDWNGSEISIVVDGLDVGFYNFTLVVYDIPGQNTADTVLLRVRVYISGPPPDLLSSVLFLLGIGVVGFVVTFSILYTATPFFNRFRGKNHTEDSKEISIALEELVSGKGEEIGTQNKDSTSLDSDDE
jgi:parallel beta-helix repeat protein